MSATFARLDEVRKTFPNHVIVVIPEEPEVHIDLPERNKPVVVVAKLRRGGYRLVRVIR